jgi:serine/threonine protein kinase
MVWNRSQQCAKVPWKLTVVPQHDTLFGGKYRIMRVLGEGGMGSVYEVEHTLTQKRAAIKRVHPHLLAHDRGHRRVLQEARAAARVSHRNVVDVYDVVSDGDAICLVMELLVGEPLSAWIERGGHALHELVALLLPAMQGVAAAHAAGVVHRDVKPENIFLVDEAFATGPQPKVIDFGISKLADPEGQATHSGVTMGTPRYVSYEQLLGAVDIDGRADVYAFGVMLYEAITGRTPHRANTFSQQAICFATMEPTRPRELVPDVPEQLEQVVMRAIARDREQRFPSLMALHDALVPFARADGYATELVAYPRTSVATAPFGAQGTLQGAPPLSTLRPGAHAPRVDEARARPHRPRPRAVTLVLSAAALLALSALGLWLLDRAGPKVSQRQTDLVAQPAEPLASPAEASAPLSNASSPAALAAPSPRVLLPEARPPATQEAAKKRANGGVKARADAAPQRVTSPASDPVQGTPAETHRAGRLSDDQF